MTIANRRQFLAGSAATFAGGAGLLGSLSQNPAWAADASGYKALVCIFLLGGIDHADTIYPIDQASYDQLAELRPGLFAAYQAGDPASSRNRNNLLELTPSNAAAFGGRAFGLPPQMAEMANLFASGEMAIVGNVGPLIEPTDRQSFDDDSVALPPRLFSHNDQQSTWRTLGVEGNQVGWGGRFADAAVAADASANPVFATVSTAGSDAFLFGDTVTPFSASSRGSSPRDLDVTQRRFILGNNDRFEAQRAAVEAFYARDDLGHSGLMERDFAAISAAGVADVRSFNTASENTMPFTTEFPDTRLGRQLQIVAETIESRNALQVSRQIFYTATGGFDTHSTQAADLPGRQAQISQAVAAFRNAMVERGLWNDVVVFTASEFGRTMIDNGDGTDHGWGGHYFVLGGSVDGGQIFGELPAPDLSLPNYTPSRGRLIPSVSVEQYAATLGGWFGLNDAELAAALPNLANFQSPTVGFV